MLWQVQKMEQRYLETECLWQLYNCIYIECVMKSNESGILLINGILSGNGVQKLNFSQHFCSPGGIKYSNFSPNQ